MQPRFLFFMGLLLAGCSVAQRPPTRPVLTPPAPPVRTVLTAIHFSDGQHGVATGPGIALTTADGGETWSPGTAPPYQEPSVKPDRLPEPGAHTCVVTPGTLLAATKSAVLRSTDAGKVWETVFQSPMVSLRQPGELQCRAQAVWVLLTGGAGAGHVAHVVYRSVDAGQHWETMLVSGMGAPEELRQLGKPWIDAYPGPFDALDVETAFFAGSCPACGGGTASITRTFDGGQTWLKDPIPGVREVVAISFVDARSGWVVADTRSGSRILATADGGKTWGVQYPPRL